MPKRLPTGFTTGQPNQNFMQSQVPSTASGTPANGGTTQLQASQSVQHTGLFLFVGLLVCFLESGSYCNEDVVLAMIVTKSHLQL